MRDSRIHYSPLLLFVFFILVGCSSTPSPSRESPSTEQAKEPVTIRESDSTDRLLEIVESDRFELHQRAEAARLLGNRRTNVVFERLINMLPGKDNALTLEIIVALGEHGNPK